MKLESLVIPGQPNRGEYVLESCTRVAMRSEHLVGAPSFVKTTEGAEVQPRRGGVKRNYSVDTARYDMKGESSGV